jgi:hypothetical protein
MPKPKRSQGSFKATGRRSTSTTRTRPPGA